jgi:hypothetical protein
MEERKAIGNGSDAVSRRAMLKTATAAAVGMALGPQVNAATVSPIYYGKLKGQTPLDASNVYPLLAAWILLTTNGPAETVDKTTISQVANIDPRSVDVIYGKYTLDAKTQAAFNTVRTAFGDLAAFFANSLPYSNGQCPDAAATVAPVASLPCTKAARKHAS